MRGPILDPDKIDAIIQCYTCHGNLWRMRILKRSGNVVISSQFDPMSPEIPQHSDHIRECPLCGKDLADYRRNRQGEPAMVHRLKNVADGSVFFV